MYPWKLIKILAKILLLLPSKIVQGDMLSELQELQLSEIEDCVAKLEAIALEQHFEVS